jgi:hypothetical protein
MLGITRKKKEEDIDGDGAIAIYVVILLLGVLLLGFAHFKKGAIDAVWTGLISDIGSTLIAAFVIIFTVERFTRRAHKRSADSLIRRINHNLYYAIYKRQIPTHIIKEVEASIFQRNVFREQHKVKYNLIKIPPDIDAKVDNKEHLTVETISRYVLSNTSDETITVPVSAHYELPLDENWRDKVRVSHVRIDGFTLTEEEISSHTNVEETQLTFDYSVEIPANSKINVFLKGCLIKRTEDMEVFASFIPSDGLELTVHIPEGYSVEATANHRCPLIEESDVNTAKTWRLEQAILPFQSIVFWWKLKENE